MKTVKKIFVNKELLIVGIVWCVIQLLMTSSMILLIWLGIAKTATNTDKILLCIFWGFLGFLSIVTVILAMPVWGAHIRFDITGITIVVPFKSKICVPYNKYKYVQLGSYMHFFTRVKYIVISKNLITSDKLLHANKMRISEEIIKIRYNKKNIEYLRCVLPESLINKLENL